MPVEVVGFTVPDFERSLGAFIRKVTIETAEQALREEVGRGFDSQPVVVTDGMPRRDYRGVKIGGRIEFIRRPASRMAKGIAAVIWVSMKPGATALIVTPCLANIGAVLCTIPMTPAFDSA